MSLFLGIDPGKRGAIAVLGSDGVIVDIIDMPTKEIFLGGRMRVLVSPSGVARALRPLAPRCTLCTIEEVSGHRRDAAAMAFTFGRGAGIIEGVTACLDIPCAFVAPKIWRGAAGFSKGADKNDIRKSASVRWPEAAWRFARVKDDGRADAAMLANHGLLVAKGVIK